MALAGGALEEDLSICCSVSSAKAVNLAHLLLIRALHLLEQRRLLLLPCAFTRELVQLRGNQRGEAVAAEVTSEESPDAALDSTAHLGRDRV